MTDVSMSLDQTVVLVDWPFQSGEKKNLLRETMQKLFSVLTEGSFPIPELKRVLSHQCGWNFESSPYRSLPEFDTNYAPKYANEIQHLRDQVLKREIIEDGFDTDHNSRRNLFLSEKIGPVLAPLAKEYSKMSANNWKSCIWAMRLIFDFEIKKNFPNIYSSPQGRALDERLSWLEEEWKPYSRMSFEQKALFVREIDDTIHDFFYLLRKQKNAK